MWMDLEGIVLSEISQTEKDKYCMISHVESKKCNKLMNKTKGSRLIDMENKLVVTNRQKKVGRGKMVGGRIIMGLYEIICMKLLRIVKHYHI